MISNVGFGRIYNKENDCMEIDEHISNALKFQLVEQYGWVPTKAQSYIDKYLEMSQCKEFVKRIYGEYDLYGKKVLELGSGLGNVLIQMRLLGIKVVGIEPSDDFLYIINKRLWQYKLDDSSVIKGYGENLPFADDSFDFVLSMQVLEHVNNVEIVLNEIDRVLKRGGICYITAPNYLSFRENHYRVLWLPLMPKAIAQWYLRLRHRNPEFLQNHINYCSNYVNIYKIARQLNWGDLMLNSFVNKCQNPALMKSNYKRLAARLISSFNSFWLCNTGRFIYHLKNIFRPEIVYQFQKR